MKPPHQPIGVRDVDALRVQGDERRTVVERVVAEEPLAIRVSGETVATTMRTPGSDRELALGYLYSEGAIRSLDELGAAAHCGRPQDPDYGNVIEVTPAPGLTLDADPVARLDPRAPAASACGICGRAQIDALRERCVSLAEDGSELSAAQLLRCCEALSQEQVGFSLTGGFHAAVVTNVVGEVEASAEDVGRHNAVDKVIGSLLLKGRLPARGRVLVVTSRASFEIVQKACVAEIPIVVCLSAPTQLAIDVAAGFGMTLVGFVRDRAFNVYAGQQRIVG